MLRLLLKHGADPNSKDDDGTAVLAWAGNNDSRICTILREHGAK
jgi:ankyrin repeat protein